jgi:DNA helicase-2/ATP-dependent DNA helicase PcrA
VIAYADAAGVPVWDAAAAAHADDRIGLATPARRAIGRFMSTMERLRERAETRAPVGDLLAETLDETAYLEALKAERTIEAQGRIENLQELVRVAREYDATAEEPSPGQFLQQVALLSDADQLRDDEGLVTLMTLHNAKGLEFGIVFVIGCEDGVFPHACAMDEGNLEEERRLAYVAITRAMRDLYLTYARRRNVFGAQSFGMRSRFIDEIPRELTDQPAPGARASAFAPGRVASWSNAAASSAESDRRESAAVFGVGDDVVHAQFGEGVVTGVEPGGIVAVRFAEDGSERKLMADFAPIKRR